MKILFVIIISSIISHVSINDSVSSIGVTNNDSIEQEEEEEEEEMHNISTSTIKKVMILL